MCPMPVNPKIVVLIENGRLTAECNNIGNDMQLVVTTDLFVFANAAAGIPYIANSPAGESQVLAMKKKK